MRIANQMPFRHPGVVSRFLEIEKRADQLVQKTRFSYLVDVADQIQVFWRFNMRRLTWLVGSERQDEHAFLRKAVEKV